MCSLNPVIVISVRNNEKKKQLCVSTVLTGVDANFLSSGKQHFSNPTFTKFIRPESDGSPMQLASGCKRIWFADSPW